MVPKGLVVFAYGVSCRLFTDVSGLGLAEQARMLMHPTPAQAGGHDEIERNQRLLCPPDAEWRAHESKSQVRHRCSGPKGRQARALKEDPFDGPIYIWRFVVWQPSGPEHQCRMWAIHASLGGHIWP